MASFNNLEMAQALSHDSRVTIKKGFLGFGAKVVYQPTQSPIHVMLREYNADNGERMENLINAPADRLEAEVEKGKDIQDAQIGSMHLEACISRDGQFVALQMFHFVDFKYKPVTPLRIFEGNEAQLVSSLF